MVSNTELLTSIKINGAIPDDQIQFSDDVILSLADEALQQTLLPVIMERQEEFFVFEQTLPITASKRKYRIPSRSIGGVLRDVQIQRGTSISSISQMNSEDILTSSTGTPYAFYLEANSVCLYPTPSATDGTLILKFFCKPGRLTPVSNASTITAINGTTISVASLPSVFLVGSSIDFTKGSAHYEPAGLSYAIQTVNGTDITFSSVPDELEVGDWLSLAGYSPVASIPEEFHPVLSLLTAAKLLQSLGQSDEESALLQKAETAIQRLTGILAPRILGEPQRCVTPLL